MQSLSCMLLTGLSTDSRKHDQYIAGHSLHGNVYTSTRTSAFSDQTSRSATCKSNTTAKPDHCPSSIMLHPVSWIPPTVRQFFEERVFRQKSALSLTRVETNSARNFRIGTHAADSQLRNSQSTVEKEEVAKWKFEKYRMEKPLPVLPTAEQEEATRLRVERLMMEKPLPALPVPESSLFELPASPSTIFRPTTHGNNGSQEVHGLGISVNHADQSTSTLTPKSSNPDHEEWSTITSSASDSDSDSDASSTTTVTNTNTNTSDPNAHIPVRAVDIGDSEVWPGSAVSSSTPTT